MFLSTEPFRFSRQRRSQTWIIIIPTYKRVLATQMPTTKELLMMGIIQMLTEQGVMLFDGALLNTMNSIMTDKTTTGAEEQVSIIGRETR
jgi:hypothetical protein